MLKLDHVVHKVRDLDAAIAHYEAEGFTVTRGGAHPMFGSVNALVPFEDDTYIELIAFPGEMHPDATNSSPGRRVAEWARRGYGPVDWALVPADIHAEIARLRAAGQQWHDPIPGQRVRQDGQTVQWLFGMPENYLLPFLCADVTPRELRVPGGPARHHANGATGIYELEVFTRSVEQYARQIEVILQAQATIITAEGSEMIAVGSSQLRMTVAEPYHDVTEGLINVILRGGGGDRWSIPVLEEEKGT